MRHAARLPPPPVFNDRRLVCLIAFCKLQFIDQSFGVCVCCFRFTLAYFCRYYIFLMFAVNSLRVRRYWQSANLIANMCILDIDNYVQIHQNSCKKHPKSNKKVPRKAPKTTLGANWFEDPQKVFHPDTFLQTFGATWAILGAILRPAGRQGGPKIEHFGIKSHQSLKKLRPE